MDKMTRDCCCEDMYKILAPIHNFKVSNDSDISTVNRYDTRSFYRTYEHLGQSHYKIGQPYVKKEISCCNSTILYNVCLFIPIIGCCCDICLKSICDIGNNTNVKNDYQSICSCCQETTEDKRIYIDIFNMFDQSVGKFSYFFEGGKYCQEDKIFFEIYFPPDSTKIVSLALIAQIMFETYPGFYSLPRSNDNIEQFMS